MTLQTDGKIRIAQEHSFSHLKLGGDSRPQPVSPTSHSWVREVSMSATSCRICASVITVLCAPSISNISNRPRDGSSPMFECVGTLEKKGQTSICFKSCAIVQDPLGNV